MSPAPLIWVLTDNKAGHNAQALGVARAIGWPYEEKHITHAMLSCLPDWLLGPSLAGTSPACRPQIAPAWPKMAIAAGRRMVPIMRYIRLHAPETLLVQCMWPGGIGPFNRIIAPAHDMLPTDGRIIQTLGALHGLDTDMLSHASLSLRKRASELRHPIVGVLVGGKTKKGNITHEEAAALTDLCELLAGEHGSLAITTSRRTPAYVARIFHDRLVCPHWLYRYGDGGENPYHGILGLADVLVVTGDSVSMMSEACFTGKPVFIAEPHHAMRPKHHRFCTLLYDAGYARPLTAQSDLASFIPRTLDERTRIAMILKEDLKNMMNRPK